MNNCLLWFGLILGVVLLQTEMSYGKSMSIDWISFPKCS